MSRTRWLMIASVVVVIGIVVLLRELRDSPEGAASTRAAPAERARIAAQVHAGARAEHRDAPKAIGPELLAVRGRALVEFQAELVRHVEACRPGAPTVLPQPRAVRFAFEWEPARSTPDLQFMVVREVKVVDIAGMSKTARDCVEHTIGMPMVLATTPDKLTPDARQFVEMLVIPIS